MDFSIDIVIPTIGRREKLVNCLNSIFLSTRHIPVNLYIYFSVQEELDYIDSLIGYIEGIHLKMVQNYRVPDFWNNHLQNMKSDVMIYLNDDILTFDNTIQLIKDKLEELQTTDIMIGLSQANIPIEHAQHGAFGVVGKEFAERFIDRQVFCQDYDRFFCDKELWLRAKELGKFYFNPEIKIKHLHPSFGGTEDETHKNVRKYLAKDKETYRQRQAKGYLWGKNWGLVSDG